ncbi:MAG: redoxin family protein [Bacteroides sp.]|nr:redoxin family protein [Bacteroides sp.]
MKNTSFIFLSVASLFLAVILFASCQSGNKIIEKPICLTNNGQSLEISRITLTDSMTVLDMVANGMPDTWMKIAKTYTLTDDKGNVYPILFGKGIELDKELFFPKSGKMTFQLFFPSLNHEAKFVDFSKGSEVENGFMIGGILLTEMQPLKTLLPKGMLTQKIDKNSPIDEQPFVFGEAKVKGKVLDYYEGMPKYVNITSFNPLIGNSGYVFVELQPDGSFEYTLNVLGTSIVWVHYSGCATNAEIFVAPKQTSEVYFNIREAARKRSDIHANTAPFGKEFYYRGPLNAIVEELAEAKKLLREEYKVYDFNKTPEELLEEYKHTQFDYIKKWTEAIHQSDLSKATKEYMLASISVSLTLRLLDASSKLTENYHVNLDTIDADKINAMFAKLRKAQTSDYIAYDLSASHNNPQSFFTPDFGLLVRTLAINKHIETKGILNEMVTAARLYATICDFIPLKEEQKEIIENMSEPCKQYLNSINDYITGIKENNKKTHGFRVNETGEISNEDLFASIVSKHRGKVVLIDFWATWCGPCVAGHKAMRPMKAELADKDITYVYIAGENSPKDRWEEMIPNINGEHYRLTHDQWNYFGKTLNVKGIPDYFILDREGNIVYRDQGFPGVTKMKEELLKALEL